MAEFGGKRILVMEDEALIALMLEDMLTDLGCEVVGPAVDVHSGERLAAVEHLDGAILDVHVRGQTSQPVARILEDRSIPYVIATGYNDYEFLPGAAGLLNKPYNAEDVKAALEVLFG